MKTTQETPEEKAAAELVTLAQAIEDFRLSRPGLSKAGLMKKFPQLGDERTFNRALEGQTGELSVERWLVGYRQVNALIELEPELEDEEQFYDDLTPVIKLRTAFASIAKERGNARVLIMLGWPGIGKTTAANLVEAKFGNRVIKVEASQVWQRAKGGGTDRPLLRAIGRAVGMVSFPASGDDLLEEVKAALCASRRFLVIEESHHLCSSGLDAVKSLVNGTPGEFLLIAHPRLWEKLESKAYAQCRQLTTNRLGEKITLSLDKSDVAKFVSRRLAGMGADEDKATALIFKHAQSHGNFAFVRRAIKRTRQLMRENGETTPRLALVSAAVIAELTARDVKH
jgi:DNA transposition AAA+ family ATPase